MFNNHSGVNEQQKERSKGLCFILPYNNKTHFLPRSSQDSYTHWSKFFNELETLSDHNLSTHLWSIINIYNPKVWKLTILAPKYELTDNFFFGKGKESAWQKPRSGDELNSSQAEFSKPLFYLRENQLMHAYPTGSQNKHIPYNSRKLIAKEKETTMLLAIKGQCTHEASHRLDSLLINTTMLSIQNPL